MTTQIEIASRVMKLAAAETTATPLKSLVFDEGMVVEFNEAEYLGDIAEINEMESHPSIKTMSGTLVVNIEDDNLVISELTSEGETSVTAVCVTGDAVPNFVAKLDSFDKVDTVNIPKLPEFFVLGKDGLTMTMNLVSTSEIDLPRNHVRDQDTDDMAQLALPLLGESDDIRLLLLDHVTPEGEVLTTLVSHSRAPEKSQAVFEFHGLQKKYRKQAEAA
jgi:hypothetical protein